MVVEVPASGDTIIVRMPQFNPGYLGIESRIVVRGEGSVTLTPPPGVRVNGTADLALTVTKNRAATVLMEDPKNYFAIQNTIDTDSDTDTGMVYVNRGDRTAWDYTATNFTASASTYYDLDLSSIVGAQQALVHFRCQYQCTTVIKVFVLRTPDGANTSRNATLARCLVANRIDDKGDMWAQTNSTGHLEYRRDPEMGTVNLIVRGWFENV